MSRKQHRRDYNGRQGNAQRPWEQESADWQNRGSMPQRQQYDNLGRDQYGPNSRQGSGYGSRDQGDEQGGRPSWPGEQGGRRYRSQNQGGDSSMGRYEGGQSGGYGQNYGDDYGRGSSNNNEQGRWDQDDRDIESGNRGGRGSWQDYDNQSFGGQGSRGRQDDSQSESGTYGEGSFGQGGSRSGQGNFGRGNFGQGGSQGQSSSSRRQGQHSGRGPKGYRRDDARITEDINEELTQHPEIDASEIEVKVSNGEVTLTGTVDNREAKRMAEDCVEGVSGVTDVVNQIRVQKTVGAARDEDDSSNTRGKTSGKSGASSSTTGSSSSETGKNRSGAGIGS